MSTKNGACSFRSIMLPLKYTFFTLAALATSAVGVGSRVSFADWQPHQIKQANGKGGWVSRTAKIQALKYPGSKFTHPFGLVQMDNGEIALICSWKPKDGKADRPVIAFSRDGGDTWSNFQSLGDFGNLRGTSEGRLGRRSISCSPRAGTMRTSSSFPTER